SLTVGGSTINRNFLRYGEIGAGTTIGFSMGASPGSWGTGADAVPPSFADGATQPPAEPDLGPNLALGKSVTASTACGTAEAAGKALDGLFRGNSKGWSAA